MSLSELLRYLLILADFLVGILLLIMIARSTYLTYVLSKDYQKSGERASRAFAYFFVGLSIAATRALFLIPVTDPPLWNLAWQSVGYFFIVLGLELIYMEIKNDH